MTNILDRSKQPKTLNIERPCIPTLEHSALDNGADLYMMKGGTQPIVRIDLCFQAGPMRAEKAGLAHATSVQIGEGVPGMTSEQIAEKMDFYGAQMWQRAEGANSTLSVLTLDKHIANVLPLVEQMIKAPTFPQKELDIYLQKEIQTQKIRLMKPRYFASREMTRLTYEEGCVYGRVGSPEDLAKITRDDLVEFHKKTYTPTGLKVFISGQPSENSIKEVKRAFGNKWTDAGETFTKLKPIYRKWDERIKHIDFDGAKQASINMCRPFVDINHQDTAKMAIVNTIFGDYFGSRLMSNIREEKGLTYGIGSALVSRQMGGVIRISSEVEPTKYEIVVSEIFNEMKRMRDEKVGQEELEMVKNYMRGGLLSKYETLILSADSIISYILDGCDYDKDKGMYDVIESINADDIIELSNKYLREEDFNVLIVK